MLYIDRTPNVNAGIPTVVITKKNLKRYSKRDRALLIADYNDKKVSLRFSPERMAIALEVSTTYANAAERTSPEEREQVRRGLRPLILPPPPPPTDDELLIAIVARMGIDYALDVICKAEKGIAPVMAVAA